MFVTLKKKNMKKILSIALVLLLSVPVISIAQDKKPVWAELKQFHSVMSATFHPAEEGNLAPLRQRAAELFQAAQKWQESPVPAGFKKEETQNVLKELVIQCGAVMKGVEARKSDAELTRLITDAHNVFHRVVGECRESDH